MTKKKGGLGRGFDLLFTDNSTEGLGENSIATLAIGDIEPNRDQPRKNFDAEELAALTDSISELGVLQPLVVRPMSDGSYQIVAGERRWRAARNAGLSEVPVVIKALSNEETALIALVENLQRADLNPMEEAEGIRRLIEEYSLTQEQAAARLGKSRPVIANSLRLLSLPPSVAAMVEDGRLTTGHARALLALTDNEKIISAAEEVVASELTVRQTEELVKRLSVEKKQPRKLKPLHSDKFYTEVELSLKDVLKREVAVKETKSGGKLIIEFFDRDDLAKLTKLLED